ncbi:facilitated trehalose transporter Tret1-like [Diaphorina citri]|jgi:Sugar (and other) transporter.|uniref:Facilitated trehalose transporter Tret1-like n=1 Tax=Diaphorina citri TaxID=121845 RepID=A0A3Q0J0I5_DIACI|nr:facilitated trehalose transporter Tret1-like [Diaphorina citri]
MLFFLYSYHFSMTFYLSFLCSLLSVSANMMAFCLGVLSGWLSAVLPFFQSADSPVGPITMEYVSWLGSIPFLSALAGTFIWGNLSERYGRKNTGIILGIPHVIMYSILCFSHNQTAVLIARVIGGLSNVGCLMCVTLYVKEISSNKMRPTLTNMLSFSMTIGSLYSFTMCSMVSYYVFNYSLLAISISYLFLFSMLPESPVYLIKNEMTEEAKRALSWLRHTRDRSLIEDEIDELKCLFLNKTGIRLTDIFKTKYYVKSMCIGVFLHTAYLNFTGFASFITYSTQIFQKLIGRNEVSSYNIAFSLLQIVSGILSFFLANRLGRKFFLVFTLIVSSILLLSIGSYDYFDLHVDFVVPIPIVLLFSFMLIFCTVGQPVLYLYFNEIISSESCNYIISIMMFVKSLGWFACTKLYSSLMAWLDVSGLFLMYGGLCFLIAIILFYWIPESKNKSIRQLKTELQCDEKTPLDNDALVINADNTHHV